MTDRMTNAELIDALRDRKGDPLAWLAAAKIGTLNWEPIDRAPRQCMLLVGHEAFKGWFHIAEYDALGEWTEGLMTTRKLEHAPTHFVKLEPPPRTSTIHQTGTY
jgi:hypothetical protein